jgi:hypothetical protein
MRTKILLELWAAVGMVGMPLLIGCRHEPVIHGSTEERRIAVACLAMLRSSLTNESDISFNDPRVPETIRALHPLAIELTGTDAVVMRSGSPSEYHLSRPPSEQRTWILYGAGGVSGAGHKELLRITE